MKSQDNYEKYLLTKQKKIIDDWGSYYDYNDVTIITKANIINYIQLKNKIKKNVAQKNYKKIIKSKLYFENELKKWYKANELLNDDYPRDKIQLAKDILALIAQVENPTKVSLKNTILNALMASNKSNKLQKDYPLLFVRHN